MGAITCSLVRRFDDCKKWALQQGNVNLCERSLKAVWHPCTQMKQHEKLPLVSIARAEGVWLYDL